MFKKILVPLDGSERAEMALHFAVTLAKLNQSELILLRVPVYDLQETMSPPLMEQGGRWREMTDQDSTHHTMSYLLQLAKTHHTPEIVIRPMVSEGDPAGIILDVAKQELADLIVMTPRGVSGLSRWVFGSVTERVLRQATCPILVARANTTTEQILIPLDGSSIAEEALPIGIALAQKFGSQVILLRVEPLLPANQWAYTDEERLEQLNQQKLSVAGVYLEEVAEQYADAGIPIKTALFAGPPAESILNQAEKEGVALIVMATHGRSGLQRWVYGSVTEKVLHSSDRSILIIRPAKESLK